MEVIVTQIEVLFQHSSGRIEDIIKSLIRRASVSGMIWNTLSTSSKSLELGPVCSMYNYTT
jgi:hypothetical protein